MESKERFICIGTFCFSREAAYGMTYHLTGREWANSDGSVDIVQCVDVTFANGERWRFTGSEAEAFLGWVESEGLKDLI